MDEMGKAMMGTGEDSGEDRAIQAAEKAIANPLLDEISLRGAKGVLINITGGHDLTLFELDEAANRIREEVDADANIIVGSTLDTGMEGVMRVSVVATGIDATDVNHETPVPRRSLAEPLKPAETVSEEPFEQPYEEPAVAAYQPTDEQEVAVASSEDEPSLFNAFDAQRAAAEEQMEDIFEQDAGSADAEDDGALPPPAYTPPSEAAPYVAHAAEEAEAFVAPKAPAAGTPSPDALARLQAAVGKAPRQAGTQRPQPAAEVDTPAEKSRFGINSLITRMTGHGAESQQQPQRPARQQPPVQSAQAASAPQDEEDDQIEIPAFLRRQAN
jgi:cell division protein FtsZ